MNSLADSFLGELEDDKKALWINFDLFESYRYLNLFGKKWFNSKFVFTKFKVISILLNKINDMLINKDKDEKLFKEYLRKILDNYNSIFLINK